MASMALCVPRVSAATTSQPASDYTVATCPAFQHTHHAASRVRLVSLFHRMKAQLHTTTTLPRRWCIPPIPHNIMETKVTTNPWWTAQLQERLCLQSPHRPQPHAITLVTHATLHRLQPMHLQCRDWHGPMAIALYIALRGGRIAYPPDGHAAALLQGVTDVPSALQHIRHMHAAMHTSGNTCALDLAVYTETLPDDDALAAAWYYTPIASLRNRALAMAETDLVLIMDGDYVPVPTMMQPLQQQDPVKLQELATTLRTRGAVLAVLALETSAAWNETSPVEQQRALLYDVLANGTKKRLLDWVADGHLGVSDFQQDTNYTHWATATTLYPAMFNWSAVYDTVTPTEYDPPLLAVRDTLPWADERYRGPFYNMAGYLYLVHSKLQVLVHPRVAVVHYPHEGEEGDQQSHLASEMRFLYYRLVPDCFRYNKPYVPVIADSAVCDASIVR